MGGMISHSTIEEIRQANDIVTVVGSYFHLPRRGSTFKALCPFHKEKTPSFTVNEQRQIFHCFGCGAGGDVFRFVMDYEKVDFITALKMLAQRAGINLQFEDGKSAGDGEGKTALFKLLDMAAAHYHRTLMKNSSAEKARAYLRDRSFKKKEVEEFGIGFAPPGWDGIMKWGAKEYGNAQLEAAGLIIPSDKASSASTPSADGARPSGSGARRHYYDRFRDRIMFPIHDEQGRAVGFSGRTIAADASGAKYVNTPETLLFHKGKLLYCLHRARREIAEAREAILCEGQIDVIRCHLSGFKTAVAAQGTALTDEHARVLRRYADSVIIVFDADQAGRTAALRAADVLLQAGIAVRIAKLPSGDDPDSLLRRENGDRDFKALLDDASSALDFLIDLLDERRKLNTEAGLLRAVSGALEMISRTSDPVQQDMLLAQASARLGISPGSLRKEFQKKAAGRRLPAETKEGAAREAPDYPQNEYELAAQLVSAPSLANLVKTYLPLSMVGNPVCREIVEAAMKACETEEDIMTVISECDSENRDLSKIAAAALAAPPKARGELHTVEDCVKSLILKIRTDAIKRRKIEIERELIEARREGAESRERKDAEMEYCQLLYDLEKFRRWETALPIMENS